MTGAGVTFRLHNALGNAAGNGYWLAENLFYEGADTATILNQYAQRSERFYWEGEISYQEPLGKQSRGWSWDTKSATGKMIRINGPSISRSKPEATVNSARC